MASLSIRKAFMQTHPPVSSAIFNTYGHAKTSSKRPSRSRSFRLFTFFSFHNAPLNGMGEEKDLVVTVKEEHGLGFGQH